MGHRAADAHDSHRGRRSAARQREDRRRTHCGARSAAGAARDHPWVLVFGLILSVILMGVAANFIARYIERYRWIAYVGLVVIVWVAGKMIWDGWKDVAPHLA
jgi:cytochrome c biogenesis protein CcdA